MNSPESTLERDLRAIDDALEGAPRDPRPEVGALQDLALALSADAPRPDPEFAEMLRERAKAGFPARDGSARTRAVAPAASPLAGPACPRPASPACCSWRCAWPSWRCRTATRCDGDDDGGSVGGSTPAAAARPSPWPRPEPQSRLSGAGAKASPRAPPPTRAVPPSAPAAGRRLRARPQQPQDRALGGARAGHPRRPDGAAGRAGDRRDQPLRRLRAQLVAHHRRGRRGRRLRPAHTRRAAAARAARPRRPGHGALAEPVRPRRHAAARDGPGPAGLGARRARQPAAPPRAGRHRRGGRGPAPPARPRGDRDPRAALAAALPAAEHQLRDRDRVAGDREGRLRLRPAPSGTPSTTPGTCWSARPECSSGCWHSPSHSACWRSLRGSERTRSGAAGASPRSSSSPTSRSISRLSCQLPSAPRSTCLITPTGRNPTDV